MSASVQHINIIIFHMPGTKKYTAANPIEPEKLIKNICKSIFLFQRVPHWVHLIDVQRVIDHTLYHEILLLHFAQFILFQT
jgi:hypothetical protein